MPAICLSFGAGSARRPRQASCSIGYTTPQTTGPDTIIGNYSGDASAAGGDTGFLLSLNAASLYGGVALGSGLGGVILALSGSAVAVCGAAAGLELVALMLVVVSARTERMTR